jgi:NitT/TauT family transport system ATP-binding protein
MIIQRQTLCAMRGVSHEFSQPSGQSLRVLDDITLEVREREVLALLGPSGCGKSTILRILAGLIIPKQGEVDLKGLRLAGLNPEVAMVFQSFALYPWMTARQNIEAAIAPQGLTREASKARADQVIKLVGLGGFADSYPRELSGGMKQRIGIARGIAVDRELLFMDEPFSQVDALTAESLRSEVIDLWSATNGNPLSIVMVSHDIKEVAFMADRIVILGANPGRIRAVVENTLPRPRDYRSADFLRLVDQIHDIITGHELPDAAPAPAQHLSSTGKPVISLEPIPDARPGQIIGLVEYLSARRGEEDIFKIAAEKGQEFGEMIGIVRAAELLDFVDTPKRHVVLTNEGRRFANADAVGRQTIFRERSLELGLFRHVRDLLAKQESKSMDREIVDELIVMHMPQEDHQRQFELLISWGRFGSLFRYDEPTETISLEVPTSNSTTLKAIDS